MFSTVLNDRHDNHKIKKSIINTCSTVIEKRNTPQNYREFTLIYIKYQKEISYIECNYKTCMACDLQKDLDPHLIESFNSC